MQADSVKTKFGVDPEVLRLGFVSFLTDLSSEMIFSVFAIFFTTIAGASSALLGLVEGFADFSASSLDYVAGYAGLDAVKMLFWAAVLNGALAPPLLILVVLLTSRADVMGKHRNGPLLRWLGWMCVVVMLIATVIMFVTAYLA